MHMKRTDFILVAAIMLLAALSAALLWVVGGGKNGENGENGEIAAVYKNGERIAALPLDKADKLLIKGDEGGENTVETDGKGNVRMHSANCKNLLCVLQGWLGKDYPNDGAQWIVCLPNGISVAIEKEPPK